MEHEVIIISGNHRSRIGLATGFSSFGYTVADASDTLQADLTIRNYGAPRIIVLDVHGIDQTQILNFAARHHRSGVRIIALGTTTGDDALAEKIGAEEILPLPHHLNEIREYVQHIASYLNNNELNPTIR